MAGLAFASLGGEARASLQERSALQWSCTQTAQSGEWQSKPTFDRWCCCKSSVHQDSICAAERLAGGAFSRESDPVC
jgi:hypothetical protein